MAKFGHCLGTKREEPGSSDWYAAIEAETLRQLDAAAAQDAQEEDAPDEP